MIGPYVYLSYNLIIKEIKIIHIYIYICLQGTVFPLRGASFEFLVMEPLNIFSVCKNKAAEKHGMENCLN